MALFESYERRIDHINEVLAGYGIGSVEECRKICQDLGFDPYEIVKGVQPIAFENAAWAYCVGAAIAVKKNVKSAAEAAEAIGEGLQAFCIKNACSSLSTSSRTPVKITLSDSPSALTFSLVWFIRAATGLEAAVLM